MFRALVQAAKATGNLQFLVSELQGIFDHALNNSASPIGLSQNWQHGAVPEGEFGWDWFIIHNDDDLAQMVADVVQTVASGGPVPNTPFAPAPWDNPDPERDKLATAIAALLDGIGPEPVTTSEVFDPNEGHVSFGVTTPDGHPISVFGDPDMPAETLNALMAMADAAYRKHGEPVEGAGEIPVDFTEEPPDWDQESASE
jgi:hypothetical protein